MTKRKRRIAWALTIGIIGAIFYQFSWWHRTGGWYPNDPWQAPSHPTGVDG